MSTLLRFLNKPEYLLQPQIIARRLTASGRSGPAVDARLPWGISIEVDPTETIGRSLTHRGIFEIAAVEAIFRLVDPGDLVLDVGANIGFMTVAAACAHSDVSVLAYEPHPGLFDRLQRNLDTWLIQRPDLRGRIYLVNAAISDHNGTASLRIPRDFAGNQGIASIGSGDLADGMTAVAVAAMTLDAVVETDGRSVGLLKIDIEGHELAAFQGAERTLSTGKIRDIVFEDHLGVDSEVCRLLASHGYTVLCLSKLPWRPLLCEPSEAAWAASISYDSPNLLATREPERARARMSGLGYRCLSRAMVMT